MFNFFCCASLELWFQTQWLKMSSLIVRLHTGIAINLLWSRLDCNKASLVYDLIIDERADMPCIIETWLGSKWGVASLEMWPLGFWAWHQLRFQGRGCCWSIIIWESLTAFRDAMPQVSGNETLFVKLDSKDQLQLLLESNFPQHLDSTSGLAVELPRLMVLGHFNLPSLGMRLAVSHS